jgi:hypothetical protein
VADEKTDPTPKVAARDTMHSNPGTPDRSKNGGRKETAAPSNTGSVGSERPGKSVIKAGEFKPDRGAGTLVTDIPALPEPEDESKLDPFATNRPNPAPEEALGLQPGEQPKTRSAKKS